LYFFKKSKILATPFRVETQAAGLVRVKQMTNRSTPGIFEALIHEFLTRKKTRKTAINDVFEFAIRKLLFVLPSR